MDINVDNKEFLTAAETQKEHIADEFPQALGFTMFFEVVYLIYALIKNNRYALGLGVVLGAIPFYIWCIVCLVRLGNWWYITSLRKQLEEKGETKIGTVTQIEAKHSVRRKKILFRYRVVVKYEGPKGPVEWKSQLYSVNPSDYLDLDGKCKLLEYGGKRILSGSQEDAEKKSHRKVKKEGWLTQGHIRFNDVLAKDLDSNTRFHMIQDRAQKTGAYSADNYVITYPIEEWENYPEKTLRIACEEWELLAEAITDRFYRFAPIELKEDGKVKYRLYVEVRFQGGFPEEKKIRLLDRQLVEKMWEFAAKGLYSEIVMQREVLQTELVPFLEKEWKKHAPVEVLFQVRR